MVDVGQNDMCHKLLQEYVVRNANTPFEKLILENKELNNKANHKIPDTHHYLQKEICENSAQTELEKTDEKSIMEKTISKSSSTNCPMQPKCMTKAGSQNGNLWKMNNLPITCHPSTEGGSKYQILKTYTFKISNYITYPLQLWG